jgi:hypothetical protein
VRHEYFFGQKLLVPIFFLQKNDFLHPVFAQAGAKFAFVRGDSILGVDTHSAAPVAFL